MIWKANANVESLVIQLNSQRFQSLLQSNTLYSVPVMTNFILFTIRSFDNYPIDYYNYTASFWIGNYNTKATIDNYNCDNFIMYTSILLREIPLLNCQQQVFPNSNQFTTTAISD